MIAMGQRTRAGAGDSDGWPRQRVQGHALVTIYQPQVERWQDDRIEARAAVTIQAADDAVPAYGIVSFRARTAVDKPEHLARLRDVAVRGAIPSLSSSEEALVRELLPGAVERVALDGLQASLGASVDAVAPRASGVRNDPPRIVVATSPTRVVAIDGAPALRPIAGSRLERVINTRARLLHDPERHRYLLRLGDAWMGAPRLDGPWARAATPAGIARAASERGEGARDPGPQVIVITVPTALVQLRGRPELQPIAGTPLLEVVNSDAALLRRAGDDNYYLLLSGRWFRSRTLLDGAWSFVAAPPAELATIPSTHRKAWALASVPGTPAARAALLANAIPETATVRRAGVTATPEYDGAPHLVAIAGTKLRYVANSATPVLRVAPGRWYALVDGVWLAATGARGPWQIATAVPQAIYAIPPRSKLHFVTYARIYRVAPDVVDVGYLPGYVGAYVGTSGTVVHGTGFAYAGWCGARWIEPPRTFGDGRRGVDEDDARDDRFAAWGPRLVRDERGAPGTATPIARDQESPRPPNDLYAGRDGSVYRRDSDGWQRFDEQGWRAVAPRGGSVTALELERERQARAGSAAHELRIASAASFAR